jgi:hypothetical protein
LIEIGLKLGQVYDATIMEEPPLPMHDVLCRVRVLQINVDVSLTGREVDLQVHGAFRDNYNIFWMIKFRSIAFEHFGHSITASAATAGIRATSQVLGLLVIANLLMWRLKGSQLSVGDEPSTALGLHQDMLGRSSFWRFFHVGA